MKVVARDEKQVGEKIINGVKVKLYDMTLKGDGSIADAISTCVDEKGNPSFHDGIFEGKGIAHGCVYININTLDIAFYNEVTDTWTEV